MRGAGLAAAALMLAVAGAALSTSRSLAGGPPPPAGIDPGGVAVAILGDGVDYRDPAIARRLARDGEGEMIGRDVAANDARPFAARPPPADASASGLLDSHEVVLRLGPALPVRIVVVRADGDDTAQLARAIVFAASTPARVVVLPMTALNGPRGELALEAAARYPSRLFVVALDQASQVTVPPPVPTRPRALPAAANLLLLAATDDLAPEPALADVIVEPAANATDQRRRIADTVAQAVAALVCLIRERPGETASDIKRALLARLPPATASGGRRLTRADC